MRAILSSGVCSIAALAACAAASPASATSTVTTIMPVTASVSNSCSVTATTLNFGTINQFATTPGDNTASLVVTCTPGTGFNVGLDQGLHASSGVRQMQGALSTQNIPYLLFSDTNRTVPWGNTIGTNTVSGTSPTTATTNLTVYGRVPVGGSYNLAGLYNDSVTVTVTF